MGEQLVKHIEQTSFPELRQVDDHPVEDLFGDEIRSQDIYFIMKDGSVVLEQNLSEYAVKTLGALERQAK